MLSDKQTQINSIQYVKIKMSYQNIILQVYKKNWVLSFPNKDALSS